jgi:UMF1 family MFS transporter
MKSFRLRQAGYWALYDFANSLAVAVFGIYFSQWLVVDHHVSDLSFNLIFIVSSFLLLLTAPLFGVVIDRLHRKVPSLRFATYCTFITLVLVSLLAQFADTTPFVLMLVLALLMLGQYFYQMSYVVYNPLLKQLGGPDMQAKISGFGAAAGGFGQLVGLAVTLPLATGAVYLFGHHDVSQVFLPTALLFIVLAMSMLLFFKEEKQEVKNGTSINIKSEFSHLITRFIELKKYPGVHRFLLANFLFTDAVLTAAHNFPIYIQEVLKVDKETTTVMMGSILIATALGALISGWLATLIGEKKMLIAILFTWVILLPLTAMQHAITPFILCMTVIGLLVGAGTAVGRAVMSYLAPPEELTHVFSYYAMTARLASFLGPLAWGLFTFIFSSYGSVRYQITLACMTFFVVAAFFIARKIPSENSRLLRKSRPVAS